MRKKILITGCIAFMVVCLAECTKPGQVDLAVFQALPQSVTTPANNPQSPQKIALGKLLFWDPILSGGKDVSCASCHHAASGYTDNLDLAIGVNGVGTGTGRHFALPNDIPFTKRNTPTIVNTAFNGIDANGNCDPATAVMFFDNRVTSLEQQCLKPIQTLEEMMGHKFSSASAIDSVVARLNAVPEYVQLFSVAFGSGVITSDNLGKAIASFERSVLSNNSRYDQFIRGDATAITAAELQGLKAFQSNGCNNCHSGPMFSDYQLHILSVPDNPKLPTDAGANLTYRFRTASLRNLALTAPYMHSGIFTTLNQVMDFYDQVGDHRSQNPHIASNNLDSKLQRVNNGDKTLIIQFLNTLNDPSFDKTVPASVPSHLKVGGNL